MAVQDGTGMHDEMQSYQGYCFTQALCNVHHLRELTFLEEELKQDLGTQHARPARGDESLCGAGESSELARVRSPAAGTTTAERRRDPRARLPCQSCSRSTKEVGTG